MLSYALIGCGRIARNHLTAAQHAGLRIVGLCDLVPQRISDRAALLHTPLPPRHYTDYRTMLEQEKPDIVAVATPSGSHAPIALDCMRAGCHVLIEKPVALSLEDADLLVQTAQEHGVTAAVCHQNRFNPAVTAVRTALEEGRLGRLLYGSAQVRWHRPNSYYRTGGWRGTWAEDGGALMNQCIHDLDLLRWMLGDEVLAVSGMTARLAHPQIEAEDFGAALVRFSGDRYGVFEGTTDVYCKNFEETLTLFGTQGTVRLGGVALNHITYWTLADGGEAPAHLCDPEAQAVPNVYGYGHSVLYSDFVCSVLTHRTPAVDLAAGRRALELVLGIYRAAASGREELFPLLAAATTDFEGRFA